MSAVAIEKKKRILTHRTTVALSDKILEDFIIHRKRKSLKDLKGKISFSEDYDYKLL